MNGYSPILAIGTGAFEVLAAAWVLRIPGRTQFLRPIAAILVFLAGYQWLEVFACGNAGDTTWARLALADVIWLPPLGVTLVSRLAAPDDTRYRWFSRLMFVIAAGLAAYVLTDPGFVRRTICQSVIATYHTPGMVYQIYGGFYQFGLMAMIFGAAIGMSKTEDHVLRKHLCDVQVGTLGFVLPALITELVLPQFNASTPSVMCHYALALAIMLVRLAQAERRYALETGVGTDPSSERQEPSPA